MQLCETIRPGTSRMNSTEEVSQSTIPEEEENVNVAASLQQAEDDEDKEPSTVESNENSPILTNNLPNEIFREVTVAGGGE